MPRLDHHPLVCVLGGRLAFTLKVISARFVKVLSSSCISCGPAFINFKSRYMHVAQPLDVIFWRPQISRVIVPRSSSVGLIETLALAYPGEGVGYQLGRFCFLDHFDGHVSGHHQRLLVPQLHVLPNPPLSFKVYSLLILWRASLRGWQEPDLLTCVTTFAQFVYSTAAQRREGHAYLRVLDRTQDTTIRQHRVVSFGFRVERSFPKTARLQYGHLKLLIDLACFGYDGASV